MEATYKVASVSDILEDLYGIPDRKPIKPLDCLILTILSQNTTDTNRDNAYAELKRQFPTWQGVLDADTKDIANAIQCGGLQDQKSETIKSVLEWLNSEYSELNLDFICNESLDKAMDLLLQHKGIGIKTSSVTLAFGCGHDLFPVDTHILRISKRLGLIPMNSSANKAHKLLHSLIPEGKAYSLHLNLIKFGRKICKARKPKCKKCPLIEYCIIRF